jgi:hypothetical protein
VIVELLNERAFEAVRVLLGAWGYREIRHLSCRGPRPTTKYAREAYHANFHFVSPRTTHQVSEGG